VLLGSVATGTTGALYYNGSSSATFGRAITVQAGGGEFENTSTTETALLTLSNAVTMDGNFLVEGNGNMTISGLVSGSGNLTKDGSGILTLSRTDNTFNGTVTILNGKI
jgi:autotransporter-associated beta strand protein